MFISIDRRMLINIDYRMKTRTIVGLVLILAVLAWDVDAMVPHFQAHSWLTLGYVCVFFVGHLVDYLTVGRLTVIQEIA
jgi:protein-S-isoprenylcysteine O-methyltransferase Ste14